MFSSYIPQNAVDSDKRSYTLSWINLRYSSLNVFQLTWIMSLHYLVKLSVAFCKLTATGTTNPTKHTKCFCHIVYKIKLILIIFVVIVLNICASKYCNCCPPHLNNAFALPCKTYSYFLWKFQCLKSETQEILLIDFDFTYCKRCNLLTLTSRYGQFNQENVYQTLSESASFYKRYDKTCWCVFWFTLLTAVHLQIAVYGIDTIQARRKMFTFLYDKFTQDNIIEFYHNQFGFVDCISKNIWVCFISVHRVDVSVTKLTRIWRISDIL